MIGNNRLTCLLFTIFILTSCSNEQNVFGGRNIPGALDAAGVEGDLLGLQLPLDLEVYLDKKETIKDLFSKNDLPKIFILGYYTCPMQCISFRQDLFSRLIKLNMELGVDYEIVMISIDPKDTAQLAYADRDKYFGIFFDGAANSKSSNKDYMSFMLASQKNIDIIAQTLGFKYKYESEDDKYTHPTIAYMLLNNGKVSSIIEMAEDESSIENKIKLATTNRISDIVPNITKSTCIQKDIENKNPKSAFALLQFGGAWFISCLVFCFGHNFLLKREERIALKNNE